MGVRRKEVVEEECWLLVSAPGIHYAYLLPVPSDREWFAPQGATNDQCSIEKCVKIERVECSLTSAGGVCGDIK